MRLSNLGEFLTGVISASELQAEISDEVSEHVVSLNKVGASAPIYLEATEDDDILVNDDSIRVLCGSFLEGKLSAEEVCYICDALLMSDKVSFSSEDVEDLVGGLTDPSVNGPLTDVYVNSILQELIR